MSAHTVHVKKGRAGSCCRLHKSIKSPLKDQRQACLLATARTVQTFVLSCPLCRETVGGKLANFTVVNLMGNISYAKALCCAVTIRR